MSATPGIPSEAQTSCLRWERPQPDGQLSMHRSKQGPPRVRIEGRPDLGQTPARNVSASERRRRHRHQTLETTDRFIELDYCEIIVSFLVYRGMGRKIRHLVEADGLVEITGRCIQRRFQRSPAGAFSGDFCSGPRRSSTLSSAAFWHALRSATGTRVCGFVYLSNHYHLLIRPASVRQMAAFMRDVNYKISKEVGYLHEWEEPSGRARRVMSRSATKRRHRSIRCATCWSKGGRRASSPPRSTGRPRTRCASATGRARCSPRFSTPSATTRTTWSSWTSTMTATWTFSSPTTSATTGTAVGTAPVASANASTSETGPPRAPWRPTAPCWTRMRCRRTRSRRRR